MRDLSNRISKRAASLALAILMGAAAAPAQWTAKVGAESADLGSQVQAFLPNEMWDPAGRIRSTGGAILRAAGFGIDCGDRRQSCGRRRHVGAHSQANCPPAGMETIGTSAGCKASGAVTTMTLCGYFVNLP